MVYKASIPTDTTHTNHSVDLCYQTRKTTLTAIGAYNSIKEIETAKFVSLYHAQGVIFKNKIDVLRKTKIKLKFLNPFLCSKNVFKVGRWLSNSTLTEEGICLIILPSQSMITLLKFKHESIHLFHASCQALLSHMHLQYWPEI